MTTKHNQSIYLDIFFRYPTIRWSRAIISKRTDNEFAMLLNVPNRRRSTTTIISQTDNAGDAITCKTPAGTKMEHIRLNSLKRVNRLKINSNNKKLTDFFFQTRVTRDTTHILKTATLWLKRVNGNI